MNEAIDLVVRGDRVLTPDGVRAAVVLVSGGRIVRVGGVDEAVPDAPVVQLADDEVLIPGLVDTHVHINEPGRTEWEGFLTATRAAAAGGVTTVLDMPLNSLPPTIDTAALAVKQQAAAGKCHVDVGFWGGAVPASLGRLEELWDAGVFGFKCFLLDSGVPDFPHLTASQLREAMLEIAGFGGRLIVHAEDGGLIRSDDWHSARYPDFLDSRPQESETRAISTLIAAARDTGCRTHIVHLSAADALTDIAAARADGVPLTVETCPHYLTLAAEDIVDGATQFKCCPPVRNRANAELLWRALADGVIDFVVTDHSPSTPELKALDDGDFGRAWGGISSLQLGLSLVWTGAHERGLSLSDVIGWMSGGPARVMQVAGKGAIAAGNDADLVVFAPDEVWTVDAAALHHRNAVSPYHGHELSGAVRATYLGGRPVNASGPAQGRFLSR
ncbi:MAG: allantoinase AllB [Nocardioides sp.]